MSSGIPSVAGACSWIAAGCLLWSGLACSSAEEATSGAGASGSGGSGVGGSSSGEGGLSSSTSGGGGEGGAPHVVHACDGLAAPGVWEEITPPVQPLPGNAPCPYGGAFVVNPKNYAELYVGTCNQGIWKSTDCGANWVHINTGQNGNLLDEGRQWTFAIDPVDPKVLYTNAGYGVSSSGAFKSIDGGVNWEVMWPPADPQQAAIVEYNFVGGVTIDPQDRSHILITFHAKCAAPHTEACFGESTDGGATWEMIDGRAEWAGGEGQAVYFLNDSKTWLWGSQSNGLWRTPDGGDTWTAVTDMNAQGHGAGQMYRATNGAFYLPVVNGILRSTDGVVWNLVPNSGNIMAGLTGNGTTMFASRGFPWDPSTNLYLPFWTSPEDDGITWTQMDSPMLSNGGQLAFDPDHKLLYSSNGGEGVFRVVVP